MRLPCAANAASRGAGGTANRRWRRSIVQRNIAADTLAGLADFEKVTWVHQLILQSPDGGPAASRALVAAVRLLIA